MQLNTDEVVEDLQIEHVIINYQHLIALLVALGRWLTANVDALVVYFLKHLTGENALSLLVRPISKTECLVTLVLGTRLYCAHTESSIICIHLVQIVFIILVVVL